MKDALCEPASTIETPHSYLAPTIDSPMPSIRTIRRDRVASPHGPSRINYRDVTAEKVEIIEDEQPRLLRVLFKRNPNHDGQSDRIRYEGYKMFWPEGGPVSLSFERFCQQGTRLLGLGRKMKGKEEQMVEVGLHPVSGLDAPLKRMAPGIRFRRFYVERLEGRGQFFFFNGSPTEIVFDPHKDDDRVIHWVGLREMNDGDQFWFDLSAKTVDG